MGTAGKTRSELLRSGSLGTIISALREENGLTQLELAEKMGVPEKLVVRWEKDQISPELAFLPKLSRLFGVSLDELVRAKNGTGRVDGSKIKHMVDLVLKVMPFAMGIAVIVLAAAKEIDLYSGFTMVGIGLACGGIASFQKSDNKDE